ncbi:hypothetical protein T265_05169 [Opisthorchis viverrini]|uniref:Uncharacterized protein n=1 Tax=Opisthorchis viverrini TaxID=6198 RepID=A0A075AFL6_OPIVI|nr:hypothetical protein T265_05169 [Opisthorchis viverrini]KER27889.1 hypothetical protein T265_05169 [Opisthorchis viverrini]
MPGTKTERTFLTSIPIQKDHKMPQAQRLATSTPSVFTSNQANARFSQDFQSSQTNSLMDLDGRKQLVEFRSAELPIMKSVFSILNSMQHISVGLLRAQDSEQVDTVFNEKID